MFTTPSINTTTNTNIIISNLVLDKSEELKG